MPTPLDLRPRHGLCSLVGAGPGDPGLLTLKGRDAIAAADVIIYDYLANPQLLNFASPDAEKIYVGKKAAAHSMPQEAINALLVQHTAEGKQVVRLKGGDPFLFGRGGEEAEALAAANLAFQIIPGVTSAIGGLAYAGIPVTHRGHASEVTIATGHEDPQKPITSLNLQSLASSQGTKVFLMGVERLGPILSDLVKGGLPPSTPAALVRWASTNQQRTLVSTVGALASDAARSGFSPPCIAVVGEVVRLREKLAWFEKRPLFGRKIVVTRSRKQAGALAEALTKLGAVVDEIPTIRTEQPADLRAFGEAVSQAHAYDWLVFTSPNAVEAFFEMFFKIYKDAREIGGVRIAAVGPATAAKIASYRFGVDLQPDEYVAEGVIRSFNELGSIENQTFLLPIGDASRDVLEKALLSKGAIVDVVTAYRTVPETGDPTGALARFVETGADAITFTSSSTVTNFLALGADLPPKICLASIGPITSKTLRDHGLEPTIEALQHDVPGLVAAIQAYFSTSTLHQ